MSELEDEETVEVAAPWRRLRQRMLRLWRSWPEEDTPEVVVAEPAVTEADTRRGGENHRRKELGCYCWR